MLFQQPQLLNELGVFNDEELRVGIRWPRADRHRGEAGASRDGGKSASKGGRSMAGLNEEDGGGGGGGLRGGAVCFGISEAFLVVIVKALRFRHDVRADEARQSGTNY